MRVCFCCAVDCYQESEATLSAFHRKEWNPCFQFWCVCVYILLFIFKNQRLSFDRFLVSVMARSCHDMTAVITCAHANWLHLSLLTSLLWCPLLASQVFHRSALLGIVKKITIWSGLLMQGWCVWHRCRAMGADYWITDLSPSHRPFQISQCSL